MPRRPEGQDKAEECHLLKQQLSRVYYILSKIDPHGKLQAEVEEELQKRKSHLSSNETPAAEYGPMIGILKNKDLHFKDDEPIGLPVGEYEEKKKKLAAERKAEYDRYLAEKEKELRRKDAHDPVQSSYKPPANYENAHRVLEDEKRYKDNNYYGSYIDENERKAKSHSRRFTSTPTKSVSNENPPLSPLPPTATSNERIVHSLNEPRSPGSSVRHHKSVPVSASNERKTYYYRRRHPNESSIEQTLYGYSPKLRPPPIIKHDYRRELEAQIKESKLKNLVGEEDEERNGPVYGLDIKQNRERWHDYSVQLDLQMEEKRLKRLQELEMEKRIQGDGDYPWSLRGGGGAPRRDAVGNIITSRTVQSPAYVPHYGMEQMLKQNELRKQEYYKAELLKQVEEKQRLANLKKEQEKLQEMREAQRIEEQRLRMLKEYEAEQADRIRKAEEMRVKRERLAELQEIRAREEERQRKEEEERRRKEREKQLEATVAARSREGPPSPPVPAIRTQTVRENAPVDLSNVNADNVMSHLSEIRKKTFEQLQKMDSQLKDEKKTYKVLNRRTVQEDSDDDDDDIGNNGGQRSYSDSYEQGYSQQNNRNVGNSR